MCVYMSNERLRRRLLPSSRCVDALLHRVPGHHLSDSIDVHLYARIVVYIWTTIYNERDIILYCIPNVYNNMYPYYYNYY